MKKKILLIFCYSFIFNFLAFSSIIKDTCEFSDKQNPFIFINIAREQVMNKTPYNGVQTLSKVSLDRITYQDIYAQAYMTLLTACGEIKEKNRIASLYREEDEDMEMIPFPAQTLIASPAKEVIIQEAEKYTFTIINEAHLYPEHRVFIKSLLGDFFRIGYTHICFEDLRFDNDIIYTKQNCPDQKKGFYLQEPNMAELVREALQIGYYIHSYDTHLQERDSIAASNLLNINNKYPEEKILVVCGFTHNNEMTEEKKVAGYLKKMGIDPLTINQTLFYEANHTEMYKKMITHFDITKPVIFMDNDLEPYSFDQSYNDLFVFTPPTKYRGENPDWLFHIDNRQEYYLNENIEQGIMEVYYQEQKCLSEIPVYTKIISDRKNADPIVLALYKHHNYTVKMYDLQYNLIESLFIDDFNN